MPRWLLVAVGFALAAAAGYALLTADLSPSPASTEARPGAPETGAPATAGAAGETPAHRRIDARSRRELEAILRRADGEGDGG